MYQKWYNMKLGYKKEGLLRQSVYKNGVLKNQYLLSILRDDFDANML